MPDPTSPSPVRPRRSRTALRRPASPWNTPRSGPRWTANAETRTSPAGLLPEAEEHAVPDDHVVEHGDPEEPSRAPEPEGHLPVLRAGRRIAARVVVEEDHRRRALAHRRGEHLPGVYEASVQDPHRHPLVPEGT